MILKLDSYKDLQLEMSGEKKKSGRLFSLKNWDWVLTRKRGSVHEKQYDKDKKKKKNKTEKYPYFRNA